LTYAVVEHISNGRTQAFKTREEFCAWTRQVNTKEYDVIGGDLGDPTQNIPVHLVARHWCEKFDDDSRF